MEITLQDRVALVTGGAAGIGAGVARTLAQAGSDIALCDIDAEKGKAVARAVSESGRRSLFVRADVSDPDAVAAAIDRTAAEFGRLDILVNNAGIEYFRSIEETTIEEWFGWRPMIPDGVTAVGFAPAFRNVIVATGHGMLGMSMAPGTGKLAAELLEGASPHIDPAPYSLSRFGG